MKAHEFLDAAGNALRGNAALRDAPGGERSAPRAAAILSAWTGREWAPQDVWMCLIAVKMARSVQGVVHADDYTDLAGYAGLLGEELTQSKTEEKPAKRPFPPGHTLAERAE